MNLADFMLQITTRAQADTGSGGLFTTGAALINAFYSNRAPSSTSYPYCIVTLVGAPARDTFKTGNFEVRFRIATYHERESTTDPDPDFTVSKILRRLYGDSTNGAAPSYGFHRWTPTLSSPWTGKPIFYEDTFDESDEDFIQIVHQYKTLVAGS